MSLTYLLIFFLACVSFILELLISRILVVKAEESIVYLVIAYTMLGYGIGANIYLIFRKKIDRFNNNKVASFVLLFSSFACLVCVVTLIKIPLYFNEIQYEIMNYRSGIPLLITCLSVVSPFTCLGFLTVYFFSRNTQQSSVLYFFDLIGAGLGALGFFLLINLFSAFRAVLLLSLILMCLAMLIRYPRQRIMSTVFIILTGFLLLKMADEPTFHNNKGWSDFRKSLRKEQYKVLISEWSPLGLTEILQIHDKNLWVKGRMLEINLKPMPEFCYVTTNYAGLTPIFNVSSIGLKKTESQIHLFSKISETPYVLLSKPRVVVIGAGGGRDLFIAKTHGAKQIVGVEINPIIFREMSPRGKLYEYSGRIYTDQDISMSFADGRYIVKKLPLNLYDLIVIPDVTDIAGPARGAYAFAENYLYTQNAVIDYLKILNNGGLLCFFRSHSDWMPKEGLRLFAIVLEALRSQGARRPWDQIIAGNYQNLSVVLVKKNQFSPTERVKILSYFNSHGIELRFPNETWWEGGGPRFTALDAYARAFLERKEKIFTYHYPFDISVTTDENPYFFDFSKRELMNSNPSSYSIYSLLPAMRQAFVFMLLFIFVPLLIFKKNSFQNLPPKLVKPFILYFSCIGFGFMLIEITLMKKFVLLLGSPIYSITVTLTAFLISCGIGSFLLQYCKNKPPIKLATLFLNVSVLVIITGGALLSWIIQYNFTLRILFVLLMVFPLGTCIGMFFPMGLKLIGSNYSETIPWSWGLSTGFNVIGAIFSIILAKFIGFNFTLCLALIFYLLAFLNFILMQRIILKPC
jgi:hypothetical protein